MSKKKKSSEHTIADVINMFRLVGVYGNIKSPLTPPSERGERLHSGIGCYDNRCADTTSGLHKFPLWQKETGGFYKKANRNIFLTIILKRTSNKN